MSLNMITGKVHIPQVGLLSLLLVTILWIGTGCDSDSDGTSQPQMTARNHTEMGWVSFEAGEYPAALDYFKTAINLDQNFSDAYNGAGWSSGRIPGSLNQAADYFREARRDTTRYDALGGWAFVAFQLGNHSATIDSIDALLSRQPGWRFLHESSLDYLDLRIITAFAHFNLGGDANYARSLEIVVDYLNASFEADISTPAGRRELLEEIERLEQVHG